MICSEARRLLDAYVDAELDVTSVIAVERHLSECAGCEQEYESLNHLRREIAAAHLDYVPGAALERKLSRYREPRGAARWLMNPWKVIPILLPAAALCLLLLAIPVRWGRSGPSVESEILDNHLRSLAAAHLVDVPSSDRHTVKPWFQGKTDFAPNVPDLAASGFPLVGGRLDVLEQKRVVALVYKRREHVINLFVAPASGAARDLAVREQSGYRIVEWSANGMRYWAVSDVNGEELSGFARAFQAQQ